ncbi:hypothetical protein [Pseudothioclava nitratireducens]|uniref:hypothetical protein n=1 Tax=Pseudothioclava nitratireducens TaxID=1928646 RepID=UPI0023D9C18A|nr:hypothetical protein [Defluviimonas nitratireducens]MDF1620853.1 hypothetical protein [Defluviimonas nitratireducens]
MRRLFICLIVPLFLAGCEGGKYVWASDEELQRAAFSTSEPPSVTLYTVVSRRTGNGGHSGLMINGTQRVMFDPSGTWYHPFVPERNDVHYGITERFRKFYIDYHARETFDVIEQTVPVSMQTAELLRAKVQAYGPVGQMYCANSVSDILSDTPGFSPIKRTFFPMKLSEAFGQLPGASFKRYEDGDPDNNHGVLMIQQSASGGGGVGQRGETLRQDDS